MVSNNIFMILPDFVFERLQIKHNYSA